MLVKECQMMISVFKAKEGHTYGGHTRRLGHAASPLHRRPHHPQPTSSRCMQHGDQSFFQCSNNTSSSPTTATRVSPKLKPRTATTDCHELPPIIAT